MRRIWQSTAMLLALPLGMTIPTELGLLRSFAAEPAKAHVIFDEPGYLPLPLKAEAIRDRNSAGNILPVSYPNEGFPTSAIREPQPRPVSQPAAVNPAPIARMAVAPRTAAQPAANPTSGMMAPQFSNAPEGTQYILVQVPVNAMNNGQMPVMVLPQQPTAATQQWSGPQQPTFQTALSQRQPTPNFQPRPRENQTDLKPAAEQVNNTTRQGFRLAERNALFAAKEQFVQALRMAAQTLDARDGGDRHLKELTGALTALDEAEDFAPKGGTVIDTLNVTEIVGSHRTQIFPAGATQQLSSLEALQCYYQFAQQQLTSATGEIPATAEAYFGMGKVHSLLTQDAGPLTQLHAARAIVFQQTALAINPDHDKAANELGVMLARHGQWAEAKKALVHSLRTRPRAETWHNLAVIHQRLGENDLANRALWEQQQSIRGGNVPAPGPAGGVQWLDAQQFAQTQPGPGNPQGQPRQQLPWQQPTAAQPRSPFSPPAMQRR